jgi:hypothetical protein
MNFQRLTIEGWRQFDNVAVDFHPQLTILTGSNGAGKSTLLRVLGQHFGWGLTLLGVPKMMPERMAYYSGVRNKNFGQFTGYHTIGSLTYSNGQIANISVPIEGGIQYNVSFTAQYPVEGLLINSHRPVPMYQQISTIPTNPIGAQQAYTTYHGEAMNRSQGGGGLGPIYRMKETIISMALFGPGNEYVAPNEGLLKLLQDFKIILGKLMPKSIGFMDIQDPHAGRCPDNRFW